MLNLIKKRAVCAIEIGDESPSKAVILTSDGEQLFIEKFEVYSEEYPVNEALTQKYKIDALNIMVGDPHALCFAIPEFNEHNIENEKRKYGVVNSQYSDYLKVEFTSSALLTAINKDLSKVFLDSAKETFPKIHNVAISHNMTAMLYAYLRSYRPTPYPDIRTALLHCTGGHVSLLVVQNDMPVWEGSTDIKPGDNDANYSEICALLQEANQKSNAARYDLVLLFGDCDQVDAKEIRRFAPNVELFSPFRNRAFDLSKLSSINRRQVEQLGHQFAIAISGAGMLLEQIGCNLADTDLELNNELSMDRTIYVEKTFIKTAIEGARPAVTKVLPLLFQQGKVIVASILVALTIFSYRFWTDRSEMAQIDAEMVKEQKRADQLAEIRAKHDEYTKKIAAINERAAAINEIRKKQLMVKTVLDELDERIPNGVIFTELEVQETNIKLKGYAPERFAVNSLATRLGQSIGTFADVVPSYEDKTNTGNYEISCKYVGPIPPNPINPAILAMQNPAMALKVKEQQ